MAHFTRGLVALLSLLGGASLRAQDPAARELEAYVDALARAGQFSGTVLVARGQSILLEKSWGRAAYPTGDSIRPATLFAVASVTKSFTGIIARALVADDRLSLGDPIARWLPTFPNAERITIEHLLRHQAGIPHRVTTLSDEQRPQTAESMMALVAAAKPVAAVGERRVYSSAGFTVLTRVLELASGKSYAQLLHEIVLDPAGATVARDATESVTAPRAEGHFWTAEGPLKAADKSLSFLVGAGSVWASPRDLLRVARRVVEGGFGEAAAGARAQNGAIQWTGFSNGSFANVRYNPSTDLTLIVVSNVLTGAADVIDRDLVRLLAGERLTPAFPRPEFVALSRARQQQLEGRYEFSGSPQQLVFTSPTSALLGGEYMLLATGEDRFFAPQNYVEYVVTTDASGAVTGIAIPGAPASFAMRRLP